MDDLEALAAPPQPERRVFCNRTLNLKAIRAIGFDMDYTLIHYRVEEWERRAYRHLRQRFQDQGLPVDGLEFDPGMLIRGLVVDKEQGNLVKINRFGFVRQAYHGTRELGFDEIRLTYGRILVDLSVRRWEFMNTFFSLSEGCMYAQLVDRLDEGRFTGVMGYSDLYDLVRHTIDRTHMEGRLKAEIIEDPDRFVELDPELPLALMDQRASGKKILLITNSEWSYSRPMMSYAFDRYLPRGRTWRDLFDMVIVSARKPGFFTSRMPAYEVADAEGLLRPVLELREGGVFVGGDASQVEALLGVSGEEILYVGDHLFVDVHASKDVLRWRTCLVLRELEEEIGAVRAFEAREDEIRRLMGEKEKLEAMHARGRLELLRRKQDLGPRTRIPLRQIHAGLAKLRTRLAELDEKIGPLARASGHVFNDRWGPSMRAGNDMSFLARQMESYADIYTSRVSNLLYATPYGYLRSQRGLLPHDTEPAGRPDPE